MTSPAPAPANPAHASHMHIYKRDTLGKFLLEHEQHFPKREAADADETDAVQRNERFPDTGTPDAILPSA